MNYRKKIRIYNYKIPQLTTVKKIFDTYDDIYDHCDTCTQTIYCRCNCKKCKIYKVHLKELKAKDEYLDKFIVYCCDLLLTTQTLEDHNIVLEEIDKSIDIIENNALIYMFKFQHYKYTIRKTLEQCIEHGKIYCVKRLHNYTKFNYSGKVFEYHEHARKFSRIEIIKFLISKGCKFKGIYFISSCHENNLIMVKFYYKTCNIKKSRIDAGFIEACKFGSLEVVQYLFKIHYKSIIERTKSHKAIREGLIEAFNERKGNVIKYLLEIGVKYNKISIKKRKTIMKIYNRWHNSVYDILNIYMYKVLIDIVIRYM
jgi:hypothetical protein